MFAAAVKSELVWLAVLGAINSVVSAYYYIRVIRVMFLEPESEAVKGSEDASQPGEVTIQARGDSRYGMLAIAITAVCTVLLGIVFAPVIQGAEGAVTSLPGILAR